MNALTIAALFLCLSQAAGAETPFTAENFHAAQKNNEKILLHFQADWCPTCRVQKEKLAALEKRGVLNGVKFFSVDYDNLKPSGRRRKSRSLSAKPAAGPRKTRESCMSL